MLATSAARLPEGEQWSYEVKWDPAADDCNRRASHVYGVVF